MQRGRPKYETLTTNVLVITGIIISLGLIALSATLNFRMGYRTADTEMDGWVYGLGAGLGDGLKALIPFMMWWAWRHRHLVAVGVGAILLAVLTVYSLTAGIGFASQLRAFHEAERVDAVERRANLQSELTRTTKRLTFLGPQRGQAEVAREIEAQYAQLAVRSNRTVAEISKRCTLNRWQTRKACADIAALSQELARAEKWMRLDSRVQTTRAALERLGQSGAGSATDPQIVALKDLTELTYGKVTIQNVRLGLVLLTGLLFELGSGLGLYLVTTPWRIGRGGGPMLENAARLGAVEDYAVERVVPKAGADLDEITLFADYVRWCIEREEAPLNQFLFIEQFDSLAREVGIARKHERGKVLFADIGFTVES